MLDTNILISALLSPKGSPAQVLLMVLREDNVQLCISGDIYAEYDEVIRRPRLHRSATEITATLGAIRATACWVKPTQRVVACSDPDDDIFLECALAAGAEYLITGNAKHFPSSWAGTKVVSARAFLDVVVQALCK